MESTEQNIHLRLPFPLATPLMTDVFYLLIAPSFVRFRQPQIPLLCAFTVLPQHQFVAIPSKSDILR